MTVRRVAITGTDGTGKTTVIRRLAARYADRPEVLKAFRAPQYHEDPDLPFGLLSSAIDELSLLGDRLGDPLLKASALFLSMTLFGDVEDHVARAYAPKVLVAERQCIADSLTYARFYLPLLTAPLDRPKIEASIAETLGGLHPRALAVIEAWLPVFMARGEVAPRDFWSLPLYVRDLFALPQAQLITQLQAIYQTQLPDQIILLTISGDQLPARMAAKRGDTGMASEIHEQSQVLEMFQSGLQQTCAGLQVLKPGLTVDVIDTSDRSIAETEAAVLVALGI